jgi:hypothetical protein
MPRVQLTDHLRAASAAPRNWPPRHAVRCVA